MHDNDIFMHNHHEEIFIHENGSSAPKTLMDDNSMHEIVHSLVFHEHFRGGKIIQAFKNVIFIHGMGQILSGYKELRSPDCWRYGKSLVRLEIDELSSFDSHLPRPKRTYKLITFE